MSNVYGVFHRDIWSLLLSQYVSYSCLRVCVFVNRCISQLARQQQWKRKRTTRLVNVTNSRELLQCKVIFNNVIASTLVPLPFSRGYVGIGLTINTLCLYRWDAYGTFIPRPPTFGILPQQPSNEMQAYIDHVAVSVDGSYLFAYGEWVSYNKNNLPTERTWASKDRIFLWRICLMTGTIYLCKAIPHCLHSRPHRVLNFQIDAKEQLVLFVDNGLYQVEQYELLWISQDGDQVLQRHVYTNQLPKDTALVHIFLGH